jgi:hypothetical protein
MPSCARAGGLAPEELHAQAGPAARLTGAPRAPAPGQRELPVADSRGRLREHLDAPARLLVSGRPWLALE